MEQNENENQEKKAEVASIPTALRIERAMMNSSGLYGLSMRKRFS